MGWKWAPFVVLDRLAERGLKPDEVMQVLNGNRRWPRRGTDSIGLQPLTIWGRTGTGRALLVALRPLAGRDWEIVGARDLTSSEVAELEKWEAGRE
jgi:hypothetical protein